MLYPSTLRDVLIRVGQTRLVSLKWTEQILDEVFRNLRKNRPDLNPTRLFLAAAIHSGAQMIVTRNLRDFPSSILKRWGIEAQHPDAFLKELHAAHPDILCGIVAAIAHAWGRDATMFDVLKRLAMDAPRTAVLVRQALGNTTS